MTEKDPMSLQELIGTRKPEGPVPPVISTGPCCCGLLGIELPKHLLLGTQPGGIGPNGQDEDQS